MKLIIKNDSKETVKNPNVKIIETTEASFTNQTVFIEENDVPIIKYTDTESMYFVKDLDNLYDRKSKSEVLLNITIDNLELIGNGSSEPVDPRPYKVYTALLTQEGTDAPVATVLENTLGEDIIWTRDSSGSYYGDTIGNVFTFNKTFTTITNKKNQNLQFISMQSETQVYVEQIIRTTSVYQDHMAEIPIEIRVYN